MYHKAFWQTQAEMKTTEVEAFRNLGFPSEVVGYVESRFLAAGKSGRDQ